MAAEYPDDIKVFTNPTSTDTLDSPDHASQHADANNEITAIESELGANVAGTAGDLVTRLAVEHNDDGTHADVTATSIAVTTSTITGTESVTGTATFNDASNATCVIIDNDGSGRGLQISQDGVLLATKYALYVYSNAAQTASPLVYIHQDNASSDQIVLHINNDGSGAGLYVGGGGIKFPATQSVSTDANTLDDYEEGTWTPVYTGSTGEIGATAYTYQNGYYVKIGKLVYITGILLLSNNGDWTGNVIITGLPFTSATTTNCYPGHGAVTGTNITYDGQLSVKISATSTSMGFLVSKTASAVAALDAAGVPDTGGFYFSAAYIAAA